MEALREHRAEVMRELTAKHEAESMPPIPPAPEDPVAEAEKVARLVRKSGVCLIWAEAVRDYVAFALNDEAARKVPPGYVVYTLTELEVLYGPGKKAPDKAALRLIHEAKKMGGQVTLDDHPLRQEDNANG